MQCSHGSNQNKLSLKPIKTMRRVLSKEIELILFLIC